jgi:hypothetical protein
MVPGMISERGRIVGTEAACGGRVFGLPGPPVAAPHRDAGFYLELEACV